MIWRAVIAIGLLSKPAAAADLFAPGTVLCSNFDERTRTCRTITTVTALEDGIRYSRSRRMVAMPDENMLLETQGKARVDGTRICAIGPTADPRIFPDSHAYTSVLLAVYEGQRNKKIARGQCHEYRRCGDGWHVYVSYDDKPDPRLIAFTTVFGPDDPRRFGLSLRYREFGITERTPSDCEPIG